MDNIVEFSRLANIAIEIFGDCTISWELKYGLIFSEQIYGAILGTGISVEWLDMDTTYKEDVTNYVTALIDVNNQLVNLVERL